jgi:twitching motility protein PilT
VSSPYASEAFLHRLLGKALAAGASDVHLKVGKPPGARVRGDLVYFRGDKILGEDTIAAARILLGAGADARLDAAHEIVFAYEASGIGRFRVSAYRQRGALSLVLRSLRPTIPTFAELGVPAAAGALAEKEQGLVIVAGGAGEGKSATVAAMIGHLNQSYPKHVITIEDPIELEHEDQRGSVCQREVGADVASFAAGLRAAVRQDPDVIMVSDLRDADVFAAALEAAELGHLVLAVVPAPDVMRAVGHLFALGRGVADLPARIAAALEGVIAQRLVPKRDGSGVALACELLVATAAVREAIRGAGGIEALGPQLRELMEKGATPYGMATFETAMKQLASQGVTSASIRPPPP